MNWQLWAQGESTCRMVGVVPLLASWEKSTHPSQVRLGKYLDEVKQSLTPLPEGQPLFLHLHVDVEKPERLLHQYDLENYLTPLFGSRCLAHQQFVFVSARKTVGGGSWICCGIARPVDGDTGGWSHLSIKAGSGPDKSSWKERIREGLIANKMLPSPDGPMQVRLAWRCSEQRNWSALWKPTGDAMGPVLGVTNPVKPFDPLDDRIVDLELHVNRDNAVGHDVIVGIWWRSHHL